MMKPEFSRSPSPRKIDGNQHFNEQEKKVNLKKKYVSYQGEMLALLFQP